MPVGGSRFGVNDIADLDATRLFPSIANPTGTGETSQDLAVFMGVPVGPGARTECNIPSNDARIGCISASVKYTCPVNVGKSSVLTFSGEGNERIVVVAFNCTLPGRGELAVDKICAVVEYQ